MKKPLVIIFNDTHLKPGNEEEIIDSVIHMLKYAIDNKITNFIFAGDLFESRTFQRQNVLRAFDRILNLFHMAKCQLYLFPGNHDKTVYSSFDSFLDIYRFHPCVKFNRDVTNILIKDISITLLPFFSDDILVPMIKNQTGGDMLISHFEMAGSTNLGRVSEKNTITRKMLSKWKKTYLGHYHNTHEITKNIVHLPSLRQNNFGEDPNKGFTVIYDDLSYEIIKGKFSRFEKIVIDVNEVSISEVKKLIKQYKNSGDTIRFELTGDKTKLDVFDNSIFEETGIDVKKKYEALYDIKKIEEPILIKKYSEEQIHESFKIFCEEKGYDFEKGTLFLNEFLNSKNGKE